MKKRISHPNMDDRLKQLEEDYINAIKENEETSVEAFLENFLNDSWTYNEQHMDDITTVFQRYSNKDIPEDTMHGAFREMIDQLRLKLRQLDKDRASPLLHSEDGTNLLVAAVDGLVLQYYLGVYDIEELRNRTPLIKKVILNMLKTEG